MAVQLSSLILLIGISLSVVLADPCLGLRVGFAPNSSEIALDGVVTPAYNVSNSVILPSYQYNFSFYIAYDYPENQTLFVEAHFINYFSTYIVDPIYNSGNLGPNDTQPLYTMLTLKCNYRDLDDTLTIVNITVPGYDSIIFDFMKVCDIPSLNLDLVSSSDPIIRNHTQLDTNVSLVGDSSLTQTYNLWLSNDSEMPVVPYTVEVDSMDFGMAVFVDQSGNNVSQGVNQTITLTFVCNTKVPDNLTAIVILDIFFEYPFSWNITKTCMPPTNDPPASGGWTTAGIFFFSVFIIVVVFCVGGCGFNFIKNEKTGFDVVPGASYYRSCYEKVFPAKQYTPQLDTHSDIKDSSAKSYGSTNYQSDL